MGRAIGNRARRKPAEPPLQSLDLNWPGWFESAWRKYERTLLDINWRDPIAAASATLVVAVLRCDVPAEPATLWQWWHQPMDVLLGNSWEDACPRLDPVTRWCLLAAGSTRVDGKAGARSDGREVLAGVEATLRMLLPLGPGTVWESAAHAQSRMRLVCCPLVAQSGLEVGAPLAPRSRWRLDFGALPQAGRVSLSPRLQTQVDMDDDRLPEDASAVLLRRLRSELRATDIADLGKSARLDRSQGAELLARYQREHPWGALEMLALAWGESLLRDPDSRIRPQSVSRYLSALDHVLKAQRGRHFLTYDATTGSWYFDADAWEEVALRLRRDVRDKATARTLAMMCAGMRKWLPLLGQMDFSHLEGLSPRSAPAANVVMPCEFEAALEGMYEAGGALARAALAAAVMYYAGARLMEALGLLSEDVVCRGDGLLRFWAHEGRKLKGRGRRIQLAGCMPEHWRERLMGLAIATREAGAPRNYLFADPRSPREAPDALLVRPAIIRLRQVTGDPEVSAHALRHSFATLSLLRIALARSPELRAYPSRVLREPMFEPAQVTAWAQLWFFGAVPDDAIHELARVMGHSSPGTLLESYVHVMDLLVRAHLTLRLPPPGRRVLACLLCTDMHGFARLEKRARVRLRQALGFRDFPTIWALQAELDRPRTACPPKLARLPPAPQTPLGLVDMPHVLDALRRWDRDLGVLAHLFDCPASELHALRGLLDERARWPVFPEPRSRRVFTDACHALGPLLAQAATGAGFSAWSRGEAVSAQRRLFADPGDLVALAPLIMALASSKARHLQWQVLLVRPQPGEAAPDALRDVHRKLVRRLRRAGALSLSPRICTWRSLRLPPRPASPIPGSAGYYLMLVPGTPSRGRSLGNGQGALAALDAAVLLAKASRQAAGGS